MNKFTQYAVVFIVAILLITALSFIISLPVMWLWNATLVPAVSSVSEISWLQAWGISVLCGLLFKSYSSTNTK